ncbi:phage tail protein [Pseudorhizobium flavum]|uniref:phage tail protein n=1 Tax=Pseudorhizobium flavum TaxID=1335061 RepID=UPI002491C1A1|nr:phage tail protein [Pseudorhizobium flavum]
MTLTLQWQDISGMVRLSNAMGRLDSHQKHLALQRAVNHTGNKARTKVIRALADQTGLKYGVIKRAVRTGKAWGASATSFTEGRGSLSYTLSSKGGNISLKHFGARETRAGVTAAPFGKRELREGTFIKGGRFPKRVTAKRLNGHVYKRTGQGRGPLELQNSGVVIPAEMLKGASREAFMKTVEAELPKRVMHEIERLAPGIFS